MRFRPPKALKVLLPAILLTLTATGCISDPAPDYGDGDGWKVAVGDPLPEFDITLDDGRRVTPETLRGDTVVICLFNTGCPDCRRELPLLQQEYDKRNRHTEPDKPEISFICIARNEEASEIRRYWEENSLTLPYSAQSDDNVFLLFADWGIPRIIVAAPDGRIIRLLDHS